ncbi:nucleotidyltransferase family protein [Uliginosibacterium sediminicola]|uniref:Nucleotidyltransferase family protein n=1 Tax=Uliginosibacterium sediminicola TaxID=2024550 RepID=A0ABU9YYH0_9RHOO
MGQLLQRARTNRAAILLLLEQFQASNPRLFGSVARGEENEASDIDLLVEMPKNISLLDVARLELALCDLLAHKIDLVIEDELHPRIRERVLSEARPL